MPKLAAPKSEQVLALIVSDAQLCEASEYLKLIRQVGSAAELLSSPESASALPGLSELVRLKFLEATGRLETWSKSGIEVLSITDGRYPGLLREIFDPPLLVFYRGVWPPVFPARSCVAIVGSRRADAPGCDFARTIARELAGCGICVVSGLATGIDAAAQRGALDSGLSCPTVAVLGSGVDRIYPSANSGLAAAILEQGGLVISQFVPGTPPYPSNFLNRNRVIAGLVRGVLVVQAAARSGSLVTARYALEEGREVFAVPGGPFDSRHEGTNNLIRQGATLVTKTEDILEVLADLKPSPGSVPRPSAEAASWSELQRRILALLSEAGEMAYDQLMLKLGASHELAADLLELELSGKLFRGPGNSIRLRKS